ncbi:hypothetical protein [Prochlorococcus marinus]|uniref:Uncharacterized protein n=1 Tax=Prochlorococcus marinus (strain MIT 9211) TaxID=93059 RepID=A9BB98_PROM4|nr:hypothetical protein [Prochlorococcus marinus]ABX09110.1 Hypothetical protein P9211_11791 [Prochlorococcus marinus str. MIT 9211]
MAEFPYLIAIALIQQEENRAMPLGGKSIKEPIDLKNGPGEAGEKIALELLLRVLEISDKGFIRQAAKKESLLLVEMSMEIMQDQLPSLKSKWIQTGKTDQLIKELKRICENCWYITFEKYKGIQLSRC